jgi:hypothetical protein
MLPPMALMILAEPGTGSNAPTGMLNDPNSVCRGAEVERVPPVGRMSGSKVSVEEHEFIRIRRMKGDRGTHVASHA